jgi:hypothetical protein
MHPKLPAATMQPLAFPAVTRFDRLVAKDKILQQSRASTGLKKLLQQQIEKIRCTHELTEDKLNLKASKAVPKILIIQLALKTDTIDSRILETIDKAFGVPVIFELLHHEQCAYAASYRRRSLSDSSQWVFSDYFITDWVNNKNPALPMPMALSLEALYQQLVSLVLPLTGNAPLEERIEKINRIRKLEKEAEKLQSRMKKEKQFNRKVELNRQLRSIMTEIEQFRQ